MADCLAVVTGRGQDMVFAEEIRRAILRVAEERGPDRTFDPTDVARSIDAKNWPQLVDQVKFVAGIMMNEGKIIAKKTLGNTPQEFSKAPR
ncbi:MAG TPA: DUF3253 domain-containing protein [Chryseolinea sp.]